MGLSFAYPAALWGLLGLPVILAVHFLQSRNRREEVSSLFLLELLPEETRSGAVFSYLRNGLQLWMQLLAVLLLSILMARPMWLREESIQSIVVVIDSSVSMQAFLGELAAELTGLTEKLGKTAGKTEWWLEPSDPGRPGLAGAADRSGFLLALEKFKPLSGPHSPRAALLRARQIAGPEGVVLFVSDHILDRLPADALAVSVGTPVENTGFTGMVFEGNQWTASLISFGERERTHVIKVFYNGTLAQRVDVQLRPGSIGQISGELPSDFEKGLLVLEEDKFAWDNVLPFVKPTVKPLNYALEMSDPDEKAWAEKLMQTLPGANNLQPAVLRWREGWPVKAEPETPAEIWWLNGEATSAFAGTVPGGESLAEGLSWEGFLALPYSGFQILPSDKVQLWMGEQPLVIRRDSPAGSRLLMNFEWATSNAARFPSMLLLLHRFIKEQQEQQPLPFSAQLETRQLLPLRAKINETLETRFEDLDGKVVEAEMIFSGRAHAPEIPGTLVIKRVEEVLLQAGVFSGDVAEGNFLQAKPRPLPDRVVMARRKRNSQSDFLMPLWFTLLAGALTLAWWSERSG